MFRASNYKSWNGIGSNITVQTVTTLVQLLQRQLQAAPIPRLLPNTPLSLNNLPGRSSVSYDDGGKYDGQVNSKGERHGYGVYTWSNGSKFEGEWRHGDMTFGRRTWKPLSTDDSPAIEYEGTFHDREWHGYGRMVYFNGQEYEGEVSLGFHHGYGKWSTKEGHKYEGQWKHGTRHGWGIYMWSSAEKYEGDWEEDNVQGYGKYTCRDGRTYEGFYHAHKYHGYGVETWPNGDMFEGYFLMGKKDGYGTMTFASGKILKGTWKDGEQVEGTMEESHVSPTPSRKWYQIGK